MRVPRTLQACLPSNTQPSPLRSARLRYKTPALYELMRALPPILLVSYQPTALCLLPVRLVVAVLVTSFVISCGYPAPLPAHRGGTAA